eukprot:3887134-Rhodomonas_salina.3
MCYLGPHERTPKLQLGHAGGDHPLCSTHLVLEIALDSFVAANQETELPPSNANVALNCSPRSESCQGGLRECRITNHVGLDPNNMCVENTWRYEERIEWDGKRECKWGSEEWDRSIDIRTINIDDSFSVCMELSDEGLDASFAKLVPEIKYRAPKTLSPKPQALSPMP